MLEYRGPGSASDREAERLCVCEDMCAEEEHTHAEPRLFCAIS